MLQTLPSNEIEALAKLLDNDAWMRDLSLMCDHAKAYKNDSEVSLAFSHLASYYSDILKNRSDLSVLASDTQKTRGFLRSLMALAKYGEDFDDSPLKNSVNALAAGVISAAPTLKEILSTPALFRANTSSLSRH